MRRLRRIVLSLLLAVVATACGPIIETRYSYSPPANPSGMACIQTCEATRSQCVRESRYYQQACQSEAHARAEREYRAYLRRLPRGQKPEYSLSSFDHSYQCTNAEGQCKGEYNECYAACGGQVSAQRICTSGCDQLKPPAPPGTQVGPTLVNGAPVLTPAPMGSAAPRPKQAAPGATITWNAERLAQNYDVSGTNAGTEYDGTVIVRQDGDRYRVRWNIGSEIYNGVGTLAGDRLIIEGRHDGAPFRYDLRVGPNGTLSGRWTGDEGSGTEEWTPS